jgi:hypothetical protein
VIFFLVKAILLNSAPGGTFSKGTGTVSWISNSAVFFLFLEPGRLPSPGFFF